MMTRAFIVGVALAVACEPSVPQSAPPSSVATAVFDPIGGDIPLPNMLALLPPLSGPPAQQEFLGAFAAQGGFPNDQEVAITISFTQENIAADGTVTNAAPDLDLTTFTPATLIVALKTANGSGPVAIDPIQAGDYVKGPTKGVLTLHNKGHAPWTPGDYLVAVRGGPNGVKIAGGQPVYASQIFYLIAQGQDLTTEQNLGLLRAQYGSTAAALEQAQKLNQLIGLYKSTGAFAAVNQVFPQSELAAMTTFSIAPMKTAVELDPNRGLVPLPIDLLRDPRPASSSCAACGHLTPVAACTLAQGKLDASGNCSSPAAAGFASLDGFSTTGPMLAPVSDLLAAATINPSTVQLWDLTDPAHPVKQDASTYITQPCELTSSCSDTASALTNVIALQPTGLTAKDNSGSPAPSILRTKPLKDNTDYAVVISDGVKDKAGASLAPGTVAKILQFKNPLVDGAGKSQLAGIDDATAYGLEVMRQKLAPTLAASGFGAGHVAMAYTFHTQSFLGTAVQLAALPYTAPASTIQPLGPVTVSCSSATSANPDCSATQTVDDAFTAYGVGAAPHTHVGYVVEAVVPTFNKLLCNAGDTTCHDTGAFSPASVQPVAEPINVLVSLPPPSCGTPPCTIPLVIFRHGLGRGRADMLAIADAFNAAGVGVAAIDAPKHGDRSYCKADSECASGAHCVAEPALLGEGDAPGPTPGKCRSGTTSSDPLADFARGSAKGIPYASANFLVSANFFRTRDTLRQDIIDESQLVRVLSPDPSGNSVGNLVLTAKTGIQFDPGKIWFIGQSLGSISGVVDVASNPRISKAVFNVGGATIVDIFTLSPAFKSATNQLLATLGISPGTSAYVQFLVVAKTILDPADPLNYAPHLKANTLPNLLANSNGTVAQAAKSVLTQAAMCDQVVPNAFNLLLDSNAGTGPMPLVDPTYGTGLGTFELFYKSSSAPTPQQVGADLAECVSFAGVPSSAITHGFLLDGVDLSATGQAQLDAVSFLSSDTNPPSLRVVP